MVEVTTQVRVPELDALIVEATRRWKAWRAEHPLLNEFEFAGLTREQSTARDDERADALTDLTAGLIPDDKDALLRLAVDDRLWAYNTHFGLSSVDEMIKCAIDTYLCVEVADTLDGVRFDLTQAQEGAA